jgi:diaminopimelate decarboxylase
VSLTRRAPTPSWGPGIEDDTSRPGRPRSRAGILRSGRLAGLEPSALEGLAARVGTPFYLYDLEVVDRQVAALRANLPPMFELAYAMKANPTLAVVAHLAGDDVPSGHRLGLDVASGGELLAARAAGVPPDRIVFTGPGKRDEELAQAVRCGLRAVTIESVGELERLESAVEAAGCDPVPILLRVAVSESARLERVRLVGDDGAGKFGMDPIDLGRAAERAARSRRVVPIGIHAFGASNVLDAVALAEHVRAAVEVARALALTTGFRLRLVDVGGGLGIPYGATEESLDLVSLGRQLRIAADGWLADPALGDVRVLVEPGRFLVGPAGAYVSRVVERKTVGEATVVVLDGGVHHLLRPALTGVEHRVRVVSGRAAGPTASRRFPVTIAGPLCSGLDVFVDAAVLAPPEPGDLVAVLDAGAYGYTESMPLFLSHPAPAEVAIRAGRAEVIRDRIEPSTWLERQRIPVWS